MGRWPFKWAEHLPLIIRCTAETCVKRHRGSAVTWAWTSCFFFFPHFLREQKKNGKRIFVEEREKYFHCQTAVRTHTHQTEPSTLAITWNRPRNVQKAATSIFSSQRPLFWTEYAFNWLIKLPESNKSFKCLSYFNPSTFQWAKFQKISKNFKKFQKIFK